MFAKVIEEYDDQHNLLSVAYYDTNNQLTIQNAPHYLRRKSWGQEFELAKAVYTYNAKGRVTSASYYDDHEQLFTTENRPYAIVKIEYAKDEVKQIQVSFYDEENNLVLNNEGYNKQYWSTADKRVS